MPVAKTPKYQLRTHSRAIDLVEYLATGGKTPQQIREHLDLNPWQVKHVFECAKDLTQDERGQAIYYSAKEQLWRVTRNPLQKLKYDRWDATYMLNRSVRKRIGNTVLTPKADRSVQRINRLQAQLVEEHSHLLAELEAHPKAW